MNPAPSPEHHEQDEELIKLLKDLGSLRSEYPAELWTARRAAFLTQVEKLSTMDTSEELSPADQEIVRLLTPLKSVSLEYPADLLAARRSTFVHQVERAGEPSVWDKLHAFLQRIFPSRPTLLTLPHAGLKQISLAIGGLLVVILIGSMFLPRTERSIQPAALGRHPARASTSEVAITICSPVDQTPACSPRELHARQDLADPENGLAQPAVSKDARASANRVQKAAYVNDGDSGASWVSASADSWIKIDLGQVTTINTVSLQKGIFGSFQDDDPGQFTIAVALSDVYADGDSSNDEVEYAQVFDSAQTGFSGTVSPTQTIQTQFPPVRARFVKVTFERAGAAIEEVDVLMVPPPVLAEQLTRTPPASLPGITSTPLPTNTGLAANPATPVPTHTWQPADTALPLATNTPLPLLTDTFTPVPADPLPSDTPIPLPTIAPPTSPPPTSLPPTRVTPTEIPPTAIPPTIQLPPPGTETIVVTGNDQTLIFTCNGNEAVIRGHANTVTLLGSCSGITVTGNGNHVFWESGSPVITNNGEDNIISQL